MFGFRKSENLKNFEKCVTGIGEAEVVPISMSIYTCWKLFHVKYGSVQNWQKSVDNQIEWLAFLDSLAKGHLDKEMKRELPFGTTAGIYLTIFFFKAVAMNEGAKTINAMSDHMEKFNQIGYQIAQDANKT